MDTIVKLLKGAQITLKIGEEEKRVKTTSYFPLDFLTDSRERRQPERLKISFSIVTATIEPIQIDSPPPKKERNLHASHSQVASHHSESATATILCIRKISKHRNELHGRWTITVIGANRST